MKNRFVFASLTMAVFLAAGAFARAGDTATNSSTSTSDKDAKALADSAKKVDLSTDLANLDFHGSATVGYVSTFGKGLKHDSGMFSEAELHKDFKLSKDVTMTVFVGVGHYPGCIGWR
ncbi:MAG TPA: hypothetical protein VG733_08950 [Chthoniobacteraceae bacterium]|nr:hypothetical protein [Chthoniobacteraceae bacterium]